MEHKIKILVAYHKPAKLLKSDIFVPIQVGRDVMIEKSKDGMLTSKDKEWLQNNLIGDNTGDNISNIIKKLGYQILLAINLQKLITNIWNY